MKRYLIAALFAVGIILLYRVYPINFFKLDVPQRITNRLFNLFNEERMPDESILIANSGNLTGVELRAKLDTLLTLNPRVIAVNLCDVDDGAALLADAYANNPTVILATCSGGKEPLSRVVYEGNVVTHFKTNQPDYFEFRIANDLKPLQARENDLERINYYGSLESFVHVDLTDLDELIPEFFEGKTVLVGYAGDYVSPMDTYMGQAGEDRIQGYKNARITPMHEYYGDEDLSPDMYDIQISANIIRMINEGNYITETGTAVRVGFILVSTLLLVFLVTVIRTKWLLLNLVIYFVLYSLIIMGGTLLIVVAFDNNYYFEIPELSIVLTVLGVFTALYNLSQQKKEGTTA
jgi:hypothetical protein